MGIVSRLTAALLLAVLSVSVNLPIAWGQVDANPPAPSRLQQLLNRRVDELRKVEQLLTTQNKNGEEINYNLLLSVQIKLHKAELEAAETPAARLVILEAYLKTAKRAAAALDIRFKNGEASAVDCVLAQATATGIEIRLLKAQLATEPGKEVDAD